MNRIYFFALMLLLPAFASAQEKWEGGLFLGYSNYLGDLVEPTMTLDEANPAFGLLLRNHVTPNLGLRLNFLYGKISGDDANYERNKARGAKFESNLVELAVLGEFEFFGHKRFNAEGAFKKTFSPYIFGGFGMNVNNADLAVAAQKPDDGLGEDLAADISKVHFSLPLGGGFRFDVNRKLNLGLEWGLRLTFNDYIDGISMGGDPDDNDTYVFGGAVIGFRFGDKDTDGDGIVDDSDKCPTQPGPTALNGCPDQDGDGIADRDDSCPIQPGEIRMNGCPDRDGDGVADNVDDCPDNAGLRRFSGCPDSDSDNIVDKEDNCPTVAGLPALNGCPDADRDGITDEKDACPNDPGTAEHKGCPDSDNDGITDNDDACPRQAGLKKFNGCPDSDNDGVDDTKDKCPLLAGLMANNGCPEIKAEDKATLESAMRNVQFQIGSDKLLPKSFQVLNQVVELMNRYPGYKLSIDGYTDNVGNDFANQQLSESRARACYDYIASKGINKSLLTYKGHGESKPIADNSSAAGRQRNRRVEFTLSPK